MAETGTVTVPVTVDFPHAKVRAIADQAGKVAQRVHALAVELDHLATLMEAVDD